MFHLRTLLLVAAIAVAIAGVGCGVTCDLDRQLGSLTVDVSGVVSDDEFTVEVRDVARDINGVFTCSAVSGGSRSSSGDLSDGDTVVGTSCGASSFSVISNLEIEPLVTLVQGDTTLEASFTNVGYTDASTKPPECQDEPAPTATVVWP